MKNSTTLRKVDLNLLVVFEALYATENTSRAAERLGMSQPAVSNALARLRGMFDDQLFVRVPRGVQPTAKARELIGPVREALGLIGRHIDNEPEIDLATYKRLFRIVIIDPLEAIVMPQVITTIMAQAPGIDIENIQANVNFYEGIRNGSIDFACFAFPVDTTDMVVEPICPADLVVVSRKNHREIKKPLDYETLQRLPQIALGRELRGMNNVDKNLVAQGIARRVKYMPSKVWSIPPMVERTDLVGLLPRRFVQEIAGNFELDIHELPFEMPEQYMYMVWHISNDLDPGHTWLRELVMRTIRNNGPSAIPVDRTKGFADPKAG
ncbi:MAG: LysR family transcriptional regulator [Rhodopseudomonas sp.]|nr:LysR family transcriptional regulator [Rhodopseudomonas sp.]